ncbi:MAG: hypothetical protein ACKVIH_04080 [Burkholderiales bacterium]
MTILESDIKLLASQRLADTPDGGGRMTGIVVQDGVDNNLFDDVSSLDRVYGNDSLRKFFAAVLTNDTERYLGARVIIDRGPTDPNVSANIFATNSSFDVRTNAANRLESYLIGGSRWAGFLLDNHVTNQRSIQIFQRPEVSPPVPGETLYLVWREGLVDERAQYVRVTRVQSEIRTYSRIINTSNGSTYQAQVVTCDLSDALRYDFPGTEANEFFIVNAQQTALKSTVVADAGSYAGISPLAEAAGIGDTQIRVASIYSQIVPASRTEVSTLDQMPAASSLVTLATAPRLVQVPVAGHTYRIKIGTTNRGYNYVYLMRPLPAPGTVVVSYRALGRWYTLNDNGDGTLSGSGTGTVNYATGSISVTLLAFPDASSSVIFAWAEVSNFTSRAGQAGFRAPEFVFQLASAASPGGVQIEWLSNNVLRAVTDNSLGAFTGADMAGEVNYRTGRLSLRPLAMIDPGGQFIVNWMAPNPGMPVTEIFMPSVNSMGIAEISLAQNPLPGSVSVKWTTSSQSTATGGAYIAETDTTRGGNRRVATQQFAASYFTQIGVTSGPGLMPSYLTGSGGISVYAPSSGSGAFSNVFAVASESDSTGSSLSLITVRNDLVGKQVVYEINDNGTGSFFGMRGTVTYAAGLISLRLLDAQASANGYAQDYEDADTFNSLNGLVQGSLSGPVSTNGGGGSSANNGGLAVSASVLQSVSLGTSVAVTYQAASETADTMSMSFTPPAVSIDLCPYTTDQVVPGSVQFVWMGSTYTDFEGALYRNRTSSSPGIESGALDYSSGLAVLNDYVVAGPATSFTLSSLFTRRSNYRTSQIFGRTAAAPVKPSGFILSVTDVEGEQLIASAEIDGEITGPHMIGRIDYESGVFELLFGDYLLDSALSDADKAEWWYDDANVESNGKVFRPWPVFPATLRYNLVSYFYLPLDASILGLDPVRLPQDGRVPIFRAGRVVVVHNTESLAPQMVSNAQTVDVGRERLARLRVLGSNGSLITTGYSADLDLGTVTFTNVAGYSQPVTIEHRIEDEAVCSEAQIGGEMTLLRQLTHEFPAGQTYVSSALLAGTLQSSATESFSQQTWTNVWSDTRIGNTITAQYNQAIFPIDVSNLGAISERWACIFINSTTFRVIGEESGEILQGSINTSTAPINPATNAPYWTISELGWGTGWSAGNVLRFNTRGANFPVWVVRTVLQGPAGAPGSDQLTLSIRGDVNV